MHRAEVIAVEFFVIWTSLLIEVHSCTDGNYLHKVGQRSSGPNRAGFSIRDHTRESLPAIELLTRRVLRIDRDFRLHGSPLTNAVGWRDGCIGTAYGSDRQRAGIPAFGGNAIRLPSPEQHRGWPIRMAMT